MHILTAHIREPSGVERRRWPVIAGIPLARGAVRDPGQLRLSTAGDAEVAAHFEPLAAWPDGSVKWILADFQADVGAMATAEYRLSLTEELLPPARTPLQGTERPECVDVLTGDLAVRLNRSGPRLFESVSRGRREYLAWPAPEPGAAGSDLQARDGDGRLYCARVEDARIEEANPLRLVVRAEGGFCAPEEGTEARLLSWIARIYFFAGHNFCRTYLTVVHDQPQAFVELRHLRLALPLDLGEPRRAILSARQDLWNHGPDIEPLRGPVELVQWNPERVTVTGADGREDHRVNADGWIHLAGGGAGVTAKVRRPWQNYPKAYGADDAGLYVDLFPDPSGLAPPTSEPGRTYTELNGSGNVVYDRPLRLPQGMAKTHELYLRFGLPAADARVVDAFTLAAEQPLLLQLPSQHWADSGALGRFQPFRDEYWQLELKLRQFCRPPNGLGLVNYGDEVSLDTADGQTCTRTTENLAYELPRSLLRQYLRSGDQRLFWEGEAAAHHLMDVDTIHFSSDHPEWVGGPYFEWSQNHHFRTTDEDQLTGPRTSHTWLGSLLDYYFLTGYRRAREVAEACADYCRRAAPYDWKQDLTRERRAGALSDDEPWPFSTRVVGWALTAMGTYYEAFPEERFLPSMEALVDLLEVWQDEDGRWRDQIGGHNRGATPFMLSSVLQGLVLYHRACGDERARRMLLDGARFLAREGRTAEGIFYYKESPISDSPHSSTALLLDPLAHAFEESGDRQILEAGYRLFRWLVDTGGVATYMLKDLFAFMPLLDRLGLLAPYRGPNLEQLQGLPPSASPSGD